MVVQELGTGLGSLSLLRVEFYKLLSKGERSDCKVW
jgi:hypothetical protein